MAVRQLRARTVEELMRDIVDRLRALEHRTSVVIGTAPHAYVLEVDQAGQLIARHAASGAVTVVAVPSAPPHPDS